MDIGLLSLLILIKIKHFLADYIFQGEYMLGKFREKDWVLPLVSHSLVHSLFTLTMAFFFVRIDVAVGLALLDGSVHFVVDRLKASPSLGGRWKSMTKDDYQVYNFSKDVVLKQLNSKYINAEEYIALLKKIETDFKSIRKSNRNYWWSLGADQMVHGITDLVIIYLMLL